MHASSGSSTTAERIERFEHMATADPDNEMAHFSLGSAYLQAGRAAEAAGSFERCIELDPDMSKAWELAGRSMIDAGWEDRAAEALDRGYRVAASKGDRMPMEAMEKMLGELGRPVPALSPEESAEAEAVASGSTFVCGRTGKPGTQLAEPPVRGPLGEWIRENVSAETWQAWIGQGTKVINELRLDFSREEDQVAFDQHMCEFLGLEPETYHELTGKRI